MRKNDCGDIIQIRELGVKTGLSEKVMVKIEPRTVILKF